MDFRVFPPQKIRAKNQSKLTFNVVAFSCRLRNPRRCPANGSHFDECDCEDEDYKLSGASSFSKLRIDLSAMRIICKLHQNYQLFQRHAVHNVLIIWELFFLTRGKSLSNKIRRTSKILFSKGNVPIFSFKRTASWFVYLENLAYFFLVHHLLSVLIFSILNHPVSLLAHYIISSLVFVYPSKLSF